MSKFRKRFPRYIDDADYTTNAPSYYDDLARKQKLIQTLAEQIIDLSKDTELSIQEFADRLADIKEEMKDFFAEWLIDGTLEEIINERVFTEINEGLNNVSTEVQDARMNVINETFPTLKERLDTDFQVLTNTMTDDKADVMEELTALVDDLTLFKTESENILNQLQDEKKNKLTGNIYLADYKKLANETDDEHINRVLASIPLRDDGDFREGTLVLDSKDYILKDSIVLGQYQGLHGAGRGTRLKFEDSTKPIIRLDSNKDDETVGVYGVSINNVSLWGSNANIGIKIISATHLSIRNVYIYNTIKGVEAGGIWLGHFDRLTIRNYGNNMGEYGFHITRGLNDEYTSTSLLFNNTWVKNFKRGYDIGMALYSSFNSTACDTFTHFAYSGGSATTYNGVGAEDGNLIDGGCVFQVGARPAVFNTPNVMSINYTGNSEAYIFHFTNSLVEINGFRWQSGTISTKLKYIYLGSQSQVELTNSYFPTPLTDKERFTWGHQNSSILERKLRTLTHYDLHRTNVISDLDNL